MSRLQELYVIEIMYPESEEDMYKLRKKALEAWDKLLKEHIKFL